MDVDRPAFKAVLGALVAAACIWFLMRTVDVAELYRSLATANLRWTAAALSAYAAGYALRIERWRQMLARENPELRWLDCAGPFLAGYAANNLLPLRAGDVIRAFAFSRELAMAHGSVIATLFIERLLDLISLLVFLGIAIVYIGHDIPLLHGGGLLIVAVVLVAATLILRFPHWAAKIAMACCSTIRKISPRLGDRIQTETQASFDCIDKLTTRRLAFKLIVLSVLIWVFEGLIFWFSAVAIPALSQPASSLLALPAGTLATLFPSTPGFVGTFEYPIVLAMTTFGNGASAATAYAVHVHAVLALPSILLGTPYLLARRSHPRAAQSQI